MGSKPSPRQEPLTPLQERFIQQGISGITDAELVELLLSTIPTRECKQRLKKCLQQLGSLRAAIDASPEELQRVGIGPYGIFFLKLLQEIPKKVLRENLSSKPAYKSSKELFDYLYYSMRDLKNEVFKVVYMDQRTQIMDVVDLFEGTLESIPIRPREIVEDAIQHHPTALIFVHNHPSGDPEPSESDKKLTRDLVFIGQILQIRVLDHIIIGDNTYFSFADAGLIKKYGLDFLNTKIRSLSTLR